VKVVEGVFVSFEERLLGRPMIRAMERRSARHAAHRKDLQPHRFAVQLRPRLVAIDLAFLSQLIALWHADRAR
jgi:hypothetical protein